MYQLFTDGACQPNPGSGGWSFMVRDTETKEVWKNSGRESNTTNNRMELLAVLKALEWLEQHVPLGSEVKLVSDSRYLIDSIDVWIHGWRRKGWKTAANKPVKNKDLLSRIVELREKFKMTCEHVYGHAGHYENEECDRLAVAAIRSN